MTPAFESLKNLLKQLPGLGFRSAERIALNLLIERPERLPPLVQALTQAREKISRCVTCGNLAEDGNCEICEDDSRQHGRVCIVERVPDLVAMERAGAFRGSYHVLHGKLSPIHEIGPKDLNLESLHQRLQSGSIEELILALSNDIEGEATCHYIREVLIDEEEHQIKVTRIGFGLPSGGGIGFADPVTLRSALEGRRDY